MLIGLNQAKYFLGVAGFVEEPQFFPALFATIQHLPDFNPYAVTLGAGTMLTIINLKSYKETHKQPKGFLQNAIVEIAKIKEPFVCLVGVAVIYKFGPICRAVGYVPQGLPPFKPSWVGTFIQYKF